MSELRSSYVRILRAVILYAFVPFIAVGQPLLAIYGVAQPWQSDLAAIRAHATGLPVLVGVSGGDNDCRSDAPCPRGPAQRSYLVFPDALGNAGITTVEHYVDVPKVTSYPGYGALIVGLWTLCAYNLWRRVRGTIHGSI